MPWLETEIQRFLTIEFHNKRRLNAPAIWLRPEAATSEPEDATKPKEGLNTVLEDWLSPNEERNLGVRLTDGYVELRIKSPDDVWIKHFFAACKHLRIDARAAFGTKGRAISSVIIRVDATKIERWRALWPRGHKDKNNHWVETQFAYTAPATKVEKTVWTESSPLPGSKFAGDLVVWRPFGKPIAEDKETGLEDLEWHHELATTNMETICRAIAFSTLAYWASVYLDGLEAWDQSLTRTVAGWIARLIREGADINARGKSLEGVCWAPVDSMETAQELVRSLGAGKDLEYALTKADAMLEANPTAPIAGWGAIETLFGPAAKVGLRHAFRAGLDLDVIESMSEQYIYDRTTHEYLDRFALMKGLDYQHKFDELAGTYQNEMIFGPRGKPINPFRLYAASSLRTDVEHREFRPGHQPGAILRYSPLHGVLGYDDRKPDEYKLLNTFPGFSIKPIATVDGSIMTKAVSMLDKMLGLLTRDNDAQIKWLKQSVAFIVQFPAIKAQVCPIIVGGQGIGKSIFGDNFMRRLLGTMAGTADAAVLSDNKFMIAPFVGKLLTFIDEVKLESVGAINTIKKLVRADTVSGQKKYENQHDFYIPSRLLIASNQPDIGLTPADAADRAFFFIIAWTAETKRMTDREFQNWSLTLKPFYAEFVQALESVVVRQHLMRYLMEFEVTREELEDLQHSSRDDENVIRSTMSKAREVARAIVADARVLSGQDISCWFTTGALRDAIKRVDGPRTRIEPSEVITEYERAGVLETIRGDLRKFRYHYGTLIQKLGEAHGLPITNYWDYEPDDWGENDVQSTNGGKSWRGNRQRGAKKQAEAAPEPPPYDPDAMEDF